MKSALVSALALPILASAHGIGIQHHARATTVEVAAAVASGTTIAAASPTSTETLTFSLLSTNPTAVPLSDIVSNAPTQTTHAISTTYAAGSVPTWIAGAPGLPNALALNPTNYPTLDVTPPTNSSEVQQWIEEVKNSGIDIPDIPVTNLGGCSNNTAAVANATANCWWTCGGCTRDTDITTCPNEGTWGLTYDDGPSPYTPDLLSYFDENDLHSTFFVVGSRAISRPAMLQDEYMSGHQIAVHTWSHPYMTTKTTEEVIAELGWSRKIIKDALGVTPIYWRPPYGDIDDRVRAISMAMNLYPVMWTRISSTQTFDTGDYYLASGETTSVEVLNNWDSIMNNSTKIDTGFIVLEHDLWQQTVDIAIGYILPEALAHTPKYNITPVIECQDMPLSNAYIETNDNSTNPLPVVAYGGSVSASASSSASTGGAQASATGASSSSTTGSASGSTSSGTIHAAVHSVGLATVILGVVVGFVICL